MRSPLWHFWSIGLLLLLSSCQRQSVTEGEPEAEFLTQRLESTLPFATTESKLYEFSVSAQEGGEEQSSQVSFIGSRAMGGDQQGQFTAFEGSFQLEDGQLVGKDNRIVIQVDSLKTAHPKLTQFLLSDAFFDVENHPTIEFVITGIETPKSKRSQELSSAQSSIAPIFLIEGNLSLAGKHHGIRFPATIAYTESKGEVFLSSRFTINRLNWGLSNPGQVGDDVINDLVLLELGILGKIK